jgi:hypothetical protein
MLNVAENKTKLVVKRGRGRPRKNAAPSTLVVENVETESNIDQRIQRTFKVLDKVAKGVIAGNMRSVIVSGAPGCGKTYTLENHLNEAAEKGSIELSEVKGSMSAIGLYKTLWENRDSNNVLLIDDCDSIFSDLDALNLLKAALDTGKTRRLCWNKMSRVLDEEGIDRSFTFEGSVIFITNIDFSREVARGNKMAPHYDALMSRSTYVDLGIHNKREVLVRIKQVSHSAEFLKNNGITSAQADVMIEWLSKHVARLRTLSIRTALQLASLLKTDSEWEEMAEVIMLK